MMGCCYWVGDMMWHEVDVCESACAWLLSVVRAERMLLIRGMGERGRMLPRKSLIKTHRRLKYTYRDTEESAPINVKRK